MRRSRGFTLLELLATLAIVAIVVGVAVPAMTDAIRRSRLAAAHNEFVSALYLLRSEAAKRNRVVKMCRSRDAMVPSCDSSEGGGWHTGWAVWVDADDSGQIDGGEPAILVHGPLRGDLIITGNGNVADRVAFRSTGITLGAGNGTFTICSPGSPMKRQIVLSRTGRLRAQDLASDGSC